jgi:polyhydroxybutyrate depolymerase
MPTTPRALRAAIVLATVLVAASCTADEPATPPPAAIEPGSFGTVELDDRPFSLAVPSGYDADEPAPLVVSLHGYTQDGARTANYLGLTAQSEQRGFLLAYPDGLVDGDGNHYWNATDGCCDFDGTGNDDVAYLASVIETVQDQYAVDPQRVFVIGHSNGGFMALRMACERADLIAAAVSVAGQMPADASSCTPERPVSVLQVHADTDEVIHYDGGMGGTGKPYPSTAQTVADWQRLDECGATPAEGTADYESRVAGAETVTSTWSCADGSEVGLWTVTGSQHYPTWSPQFAPDVADWMLAHGRTS